MEVRPLSAVLAFLAACGGATSHERMPEGPTAHSQLADDDRYVPSYGKPELQKAL